MGTHRVEDQNGDSAVAIVLRSGGEIHEHRGLEKQLNKKKFCSICGQVGHDANSRQCPYLTIDLQ